MVPSGEEGAIAAVLKQSSLILFLRLVHGPSKRGQGGLGFPPMLLHFPGVEGRGWSVSWNTGEDNGVMCRETKSLEQL